MFVLLFFLFLHKKWKRNYRYRTVPYRKWRYRKIQYGTVVCNYLRLLYKFFKIKIQIVIFSSVVLFSTSTNTRLDLIMNSRISTNAFNIMFEVGVVWYWDLFCTNGMVDFWILCIWFGNCVNWSWGGVITCKVVVVKWFILLSCNLFCHFSFLGMVMIFLEITNDWILTIV